MISETPVVILAGGKGLRIRSKLSDVPKPMIRFLGKLFLQYRVEQLRKTGFKNIIITVGYKAEQIIDYFGDGSKFGVQITYSIEDKPLVTGVAIKKLKGLINKPFFVVSADTYYEFWYRNPKVLRKI